MNVSAVEVQWAATFDGIACNYQKQKPPSYRFSSIVVAQAATATATAECTDRENAAHKAETCYGVIEKVPVVHPMRTAARVMHPRSTGLSCRPFK